MAVSKKYAGLPDLDAAPEVYETPELADDVSTLPTGTVRTISPSPSDDDETRPGLDRQPLDRDGARRRFEPSIVDARDVDFSDSVGGTRRAYRTRNSRRRRRWLQGNEINEGGGDASDSEEETLATKLARLKREAEEVRLELERREREKEQEKDEEGEFKDSLEEQQQQQHQGAGGAGAEDEDVDVDGVRELSRVLDGLSLKAKLKAGTSAEDEFMSRLNSSSLRQGQRHQQRETSTVSSKEEAAQAAPATLSAVAAFSDRLTALESALGVSSTSAASQTGAILPTLASLSTQVTTLSATLAPQSTGASGETLPSTSASQTNTALLETISAKLKTLIAESDRLAASRKQALASLADLHDKRMQQLVSATVHSNTTRPRLRGLSTTSSSAAAAINAQHANESKQGEIADVGPGEESLQIQSRLFLDEQSAKITALYNVLPTIQNLQPLLPVVLERLRTLSVIHDGAAQAKGLVDELESRQGETREEIARWREAVETVEKGMEELEGVMKENVEVIGGRVGEMEGRIGRLEGAR